MARNYDAYLETYGHVYGDMSDPAKRAETIAMLRRRDAKVAASAMRELWRECTEMATADLVKAIRIKSIFFENHEMHARRYGNGEFYNHNLYRVDLWYFRMWNTELARRNGTKRRMNN